MAALRTRSPQVFRFSEPAQQIQYALTIKHLERQTSCVTANKRLASHIGKYDGLFARLCVLWHCLEGATGEEISESTAQRVADFMQKFLRHAIVFCVAIIGLDNHDNVSQVAGYILAKKLTRVTVGIFNEAREAPTGLKCQEVEIICDQLESLGWLFKITGPPRDSAHWEVNPQVHQ